MRIGRDLVLLTKKDGVYTVLLVSRTWLEKENIEDEVCVY